jgi:hypothetical protein
MNEGGQAIVGKISHGGVGLARKDGVVLMNAVYPFQKSPRCSATSPEQEFEAREGRRAENPPKPSSMG